VTQSNKLRITRELSERRIVVLGGSSGTGLAVATDLTKARHAFELRDWAALAAVKYASPHIRRDGSIVLSSGSFERTSGKA
jgi:hypothetical protein